MKLDSLYASYKKETGQLLYWLIQTSNNISQSLDPSKNDCQLKVNLTGQDCCGRGMLTMRWYYTSHRNVYKACSRVCFQDWGQVEQAARQEVY